MVHSPILTLSLYLLITKQTVLFSIRLNILETITDCKRNGPKWAAVAQARLQGCYN